MIHVIAEIQLHSGKSGEFLTIIKGLVPQVQAEDGCVEYGPALDLKTSIESQAPIASDHVTMIEKWSDLESLERHLAAPHMVAFRESAGPLIQTLKLRILQPANT